jgi:hypothetical protein
MTNLWSEHSKILLTHWKYLVMRDGIMYRHFVNPDRIRSFLQLVVPEKYRADLMSRAHGGMTENSSVTRRQKIRCVGVYSGLRGGPTCSIG